MEVCVYSVGHSGPVSLRPADITKKKKVNKLDRREHALYGCSFVSAGPRQ